MKLAITGLCLLLVSPLLFKERTYSTPSIQAEAGTRPVSKSDVADVASLVESVDNIDDFIERM